MKKEKKHTYSPNNAHLASFGLYLIVVTLQHPPSPVIRRLYSENTVNIKNTTKKEKKTHL